jgi:cardiolipin synthase
MTQAEFSLWFAVFALAVDFVIRVMAIIIVPRNRRPSSALGWLLAIFFIP